MIITCLKGGLLPDFNKCIPYGEHDIAMYISEEACFVFYDIFDCKTQSRFSLGTFLDVEKDVKINQEEAEFRLNYFKKHKKALISRALSNPDETIFFNSIESEVLSKYLCEAKFSCKVDIYVKGEKVELIDVIEDKEMAPLILEFVEFFNMCEFVDAKELAEIRKGIYSSKSKDSMAKMILGGTIIGALGVIAGMTLGHKFNFKKCFKNKSEMIEQED